MTRGDIIRELGWPMRFGMDSELLDRIERVMRLAEAAAAKCGGCGKSAAEGWALYCVKCCEGSMVAAAVAEEREAAAKECETLLPSKRIFDQRYYEAVEDCVATIRARGEQEQTR